MFNSVQICPHGHLPSCMLMLLNSLVQMLQTELQTWLCEIGSLRLMISQDFSSRHSLSISKSHSHSQSQSVTASATATIQRQQWSLHDQRVGRQTRGTSDHLATTIRAATCRFNGKDGRHHFERYQCPIVSAWAVMRCRALLWTRLLLILLVTSLIMVRLTLY